MPNGNNGEIKKTNGQWSNIISLKEYTDARIADEHQLVNNQFADRDRASETLVVTVKETQQAMEKRLEGMNEFRNSLRDAQTTFISRTEHTMMMNKYDQNVGSLKESVDKLENTVVSMQVKIWIIISIGSLLGSIIAAIFISYVAGKM